MTINNNKGILDFKGFDPERVKQPVLQSAAIESRFNAMEEKIKLLEKENMGIKAELLETKELLAISLKRNTQIETAIFEHDAEGEIIRGEDNQPVLNAPQAPEKPTQSITSETPIIPKTTLEHKATELVTRITGKIKSGKNEVFMDNAELNHFLKCELPEELKSNDTNLRRVKKRVMEKAKQLFPDSIFINKSKHGRHETRIVFKQPYLCNGNGTLV
jgi:hypothetical protein